MLNRLQKVLYHYIKPYTYSFFSWLLQGFRPGHVSRLRKKFSRRHPCHLISVTVYKHTFVLPELHRKNSKIWVKYVQFIHAVASRLHKYLQSCVKANTVFARLIVMDSTRQIDCPSFSITIDHAQAVACILVYAEIADPFILLNV